MISYVTSEWIKTKDSPLLYSQEQKDKENED